MVLDVLAADSSKVGTQLEKTYPNTTRGTIDYDGKVSRYPWKFKAETRIDSKTVAELKAGAAKKTADKPGVKQPAIKPGESKRTNAKPGNRKPPKVRQPKQNRQIQSRQT